MAQFYTDLPELDEARAAAAFRQLVAHLRARSEVQNIDLMNLAGFCRNCLADWYAQPAAAGTEALDRTAARTAIYGMPPDAWKALYQRP